MAGPESLAELKYSARLGKTFLVGCLVGGWLVGGWLRKAENKSKPQHSTYIMPSKRIAELQHSAWLGKTFPGGWMGGWGKAENKAKAQHSWGLGLAELGNKL